MDIDCSGGSSEGRGGQGKYFGRDSLVALMMRGSNTTSAVEYVSLIDTALRRLFTVRFRLGNFDPKELQVEYNAVCSMQCRM
jgi:hypothetical protein